MGLHCSPGPTSPDSPSGESPHHLHVSSHMNHTTGILFVIWEMPHTLYTHIHTLLCSLWRGHRLFLSAHLPAAGWLSEPCLWWLRHVWGSRGFKQQASCTPWMANISASNLLPRGRFMNHLWLTLIWDDMHVLISLSIIIYVKNIESSKLHDCIHSSLPCPHFYWLIKSGLMSGFHYMVIMIKRVHDEDEIAKGNLKKMLARCWLIYRLSDIIGWYWPVTDKTVSAYMLTNIHW